MRVDDVDAEFRRLKDQVEVVHEPKLMPWGNRAAQFRDPEGTIPGNQDAEVAESAPRAPSRRSNGAVRIIRAYVLCAASHARASAEM